MRMTLVASGLALILSGHQARAQFIHAERPIPGYVCMRLKITHDQAVDQSFTVPVFTSPSRASKKVGIATSIPFVAQPFHPENSFQEILTLGNKQAWIETKWLAPYPTSQFPNARCTPSVMSDGSLGTSGK